MYYSFKYTLVRLIGHNMQCSTFVCWLTCAPASISTWTTFTCPSCADIWSAVNPHCIYIYIYKPSKVLKVHLVVCEMATNLVFWVEMCMSLNQCLDNINVSNATCYHQWSYSVLRGQWKTSLTVAGLVEQRNRGREQSCLVGKFFLPKLQVSVSYGQAQ